MKIFGYELIKEDELRNLEKIRKDSWRIYSACEVEDCLDHVVGALTMSTHGGPWVGPDLVYMCETHMRLILFDMDKGADIALKGGKVARGLFRGYTGTSGYSGYSTISGYSGTLGNSGYSGTTP